MDYKEIVREVFFYVVIILYFIWIGFTGKNWALSSLELDVSSARDYFPAVYGKNLPVMQETPVWFLGPEDPLEKG